MRLHCQRRRDAVLAAVHPGLRVLAGAAALNLLIALEDPRQETAILSAARLEGLGLGGLIADGYCEPPDDAGVIVGYAAACVRPRRGGGWPPDSIVSRPATARRRSGRSCR
jgi:hypothetical protein